ncbi:hypothetical protein F5887DRAFT_1018596 [Amanita rubescens]|nr:hypothetical protein F5887DRAFT_1018596 [Amanita rubescens]
MPSGWTPTGAILKDVLNSHLDRIDQYSKIPPLDIIVLTDGVPSQAVARLKSSDTIPTRWASIHTDRRRARCERGLTALVKGDKGKIWFWPPELRRIVLGGLHPNVRALVPESWLAKDTAPPPEPPANMEIAQVMKPPPPPQTVQGYNPVMDMPRPTVIEDYLRNYDVLFIIDDSGSMLGSRWDETRDALLEIADYALKLNVRSMSLRFMNCDIYDQGAQGAETIKSRFDGIMPSGWTPTGAILKDVLNSHLDRIDRTVSNSEEYSKIPPLDIIVLTDGVPTDDPASVIEQAVARLKNSRYHPNTMGIQFVQIGDEPDAKEVLTALVKGDKGSIVDTVPYRGDLASTELRRIVLGGLHPNVRALVPERPIDQ